MKERSSGNCKTWQEEVYWKRFHGVQFSLFLPSDFHHHLKLPMKFTNNMMAHLPDKVVLKGPNEVAWNVNLMIIKGDCAMLTGDGWQEFAKAYSLQTKDLLIFKYDRIECFDVLIFDQTLCEREASYFVRKCQQQQESNDGCDRQAKSKLSDYVSDTSQEGHDDFEYAPTKNPERSTRNKRSLKDYSSDHNTQDSDGSDVDDSNKLQISNEHKSNAKRQKSMEMNSGSQKKVSCFSAVRNSGRAVPSNVSAGKRKIYTGVSDESKTSDDQDKSIPAKHNCQRMNSTTPKRDSFHSADHSGLNKPPSNNMKGRKSYIAEQVPSKSNRKGACYKSNRRPVTAAEKQKAHDMAVAQRNSTHGSFIAIMRPSSVYYRFHMVFPAEWKATHVLQGKQEVILRVKDKTWVIGFLYTLNHGHGGLGRGWMKFARDNFLEEFDVCLFVPADEKNGSLVLDVSIFRVVQEITPLSPSN